MCTDRKRREVIREYKERKPRRGAYAVRCRPTGDVWVGSSMNLDATRNGVWFALRHGSHLDKGLQSVWNAQGEPEFEYEILEQLDEEVSPLAVRDLLKERKAHWLAQFGAHPLL
jgi:hypothetical protein